MEFHPENKDSYFKEKLLENFQDSLKILSQFFLFEEISFIPVLSLLFIPVRCHPP